MKRFAIISLLLMLVLAGEAAGYAVSLVPTTQTISGGQDALIDVNLALTGQEVLNGFDLKLTFDPTVLGFRSFNTNLLNPADPFDTAFLYIGGFTYEPTQDPTIVSFDGFLSDPALTPLTGNITLASLVFSGIGGGTTPLMLEGTLDLGNAVLDQALATASAKVAPVPEPGTFVMLAFGLAGLAGFRKKFQKA